MPTCCTPTAIPSCVFDLDDLVILIGADESGSLLEVGVVVGVVVGDGVAFIVHAMDAREKFLR